MNKQIFLTELREGLAGLPQEDIAERLAFYGEMIDDRVEEGISEEAAVAEIGPVEQIVSQIVADTPLPKIVKQRMTPQRRLQAWETVLLVLGFPVWCPLLIAAFAVLLSVYVVLWALIVCLWAVELSLIVSGLLAAAVGVEVIFTAGSNKLSLLLTAAGFLVCEGLAVFLFYGCKAATVGAARLTKKIALGVKTLFLRKEHKE